MAKYDYREGERLEDGPACMVVVADGADAHGFVRFKVVREINGIAAVSDAVGDLDEITVQGVVSDNGLIGLFVRGFSATPRPYWRLGSKGRAFKVAALGTVGEGRDAEMQIVAVLAALDESAIA